MTRERAKELLPIIQAFAEGKQIQSRENGGPWEDITNANWFSREVCEYRIKPEPRERFIVHDRLGNEAIFNSEEEAKDFLCGTIKVGDITHYREVING